jgi:hypothetical protein
VPSLCEELERLSGVVADAQRRLAGSLQAGTSELLRRLALARHHMETAREALLGNDRIAPAPVEEHLRGSSRAVPIQDLLCFLATTKKSGVLRVEAASEHFLLQLDQGAVVYATGDAPPAGQGLKDLLAARGEATPGLPGSLPERTAAGTWFDRNLVGTSWVARDALAGAIQQQTRLSFFRLCAAGDTRFRFYEGAEIENVVPIKHSAMELLLEYSRVQDEQRVQTVPLECRGRPVPHLHGRRTSG